MLGPNLDIDRLQENAVHCYNGKDLLQAKKICERILSRAPDSPDALNLLGLIAYQNRDLEAAVTLFTRAVGISPEQFEYYRNLGRAYIDMGMPRQATACFRQVVKLNPDSAEGYFKIGVIEYESGNIDRALICFNRVLDIQPAFTAVHILMGDLLQQTGQADSALSHYLDALEFEPRSSELFYKIGKIYQQQGKLNHAELNFHRALELNPEMPDALFNLAVVHSTRGECETAIQYYQRILKIAPDSVETLYNLASLIAKVGRIDTAVGLLQKALRITPNNSVAHNNLGLYWKALGQVDKAIRQFKKAIGIDPTPANFHLNLAISLLLTGEYTEGWREYDWRFEVEAYKTNYRYRDRKMWDGKSFKDKCLLVHEDQGLGDSLQFVRYIPLVKKMGGTVIFEARREIVPLLIDFPGIDMLLERPPEGPSKVEFDYYIPLLSIPGRMDTQPDSIPADLPYIFAGAENCAFWKEKMKRPTIKIGLLWAGNPLHVNDENRSCSLDRFQWLQDISNISLFSLQKSLSPEEKNHLSELGIENFGTQFNDFSDTAAVIENLDLVITVDTAVAHLAGAMGQTTWILLPFDPDWRWMTVGSDSPWYPSMRLFRQNRPGDWDSAMSAVYRALQEWLQPFGKKAELNFSHF